MCIDCIDQEELIFVPVEKDHRRSREIEKARFKQQDAMYQARAKKTDLLPIEDRAFRPAFSTANEMAYCPYTGSLITL